MSIRSIRMIVTVAAACTRTGGAGGVGPTAAARANIHPVTACFNDLLTLVRKVQRGLTGGANALVGNSGPVPDADAPNRYSPGRGNYRAIAVASPKAIC